MVHCMIDEVRHAIRKYSTVSSLLNFSSNLDPEVLQKFELLIIICMHGETACSVRLVVRG